MVSLTTQFHVEWRKELPQMEAAREKSLEQFTLIVVLIIFCHTFATHDEWQSCNKSNLRNFVTSSALFTKFLSPIFPASFDQNNTPPDNDIYDNNIRDVSEENDNIDLDYSKEENDENTIINIDHQLSESEITIKNWKKLRRNNIF